MRNWWRAIYIVWQKDLPDTKFILFIHKRISKLHYVIVEAPFMKNITLTIPLAACSNKALNNFVLTWVYSITLFNVNRSAIEFNAAHKEMAINYVSHPGADLKENA